MSAIDRYYAALDRLKNHKPQVLTKGQYKLTQNAVCLEAGNEEGSIKPSRGDEWKKLVADIKDAAKSFKSPLSKQKKAEKKASDNKQSADDYRNKWQAALNREAQLVEYIRHLEDRLLKLESQVVTELHPEKGQDYID
jgi:predicted  nucleic acid-binding Zn-ribbon protein